MIKKLACSLALMAFIPVSASAESVVNLPYNYLFNGDVFIKGLNASQCLATDANKKLISSGAACGGGGGGVTAVTGSGNILSSGGSTPDITTVSSPIFTGDVTYDGNERLSHLGNTVNGVPGNELLLTNTGSITDELAVDHSGNMGINGSLTAVGLTATGLSAGAGDCAAIGSGGSVTDFGAPCGGGGGVSSVVSDSPLGVTATPTTGAVHIAIPNNAIFGGTIGVGGVNTGAGDVDTGTIHVTSIFGAQCAAFDNTQNLVGTGNPCPVMHKNGSGTDLPIHIEVDNSHTLSPGSSFLFSYNTNYAVAPICQVTGDANNAAVAGILYVAAVGNFNVEIHNGTDVTQDPQVTCIGN
jgi:hypothetical protein